MLMKDFSSLDKRKSKRELIAKLQKGIRWFDFVDGVLFGPKIRSNLV